MDVLEVKVITTCERRRERKITKTIVGGESYPARLVVSLQDLQDTPSFTARCFGTLN